jgi:excisionase family DNA binding protein
MQCRTKGHSGIQSTQEGERRSPKHGRLIVSLHVAQNPIHPPLRQSVRAKRAAELCDCDLSTIYKLLRSNQLEGWRDGRSIKVYVDSIEARQARNRIGGTEEAQQRPKRRSAPVPAAHNDALSRLRERGCL